MKSTQCILVDDHRLFRKGLSLLLEEFNTIEVIAQADNGQDLIELLKQHTPDLILMDIDMPLMNGIEATTHITQFYPKVKVIALSSFSEEEYYHKMVEAGVKGFVQKDSNADELKKAIFEVLKGGSYFSQELLRNIIMNIKHASNEKERNSQIVEVLSDREKEILYSICKGFTNNEIADNLFISPRTVDKHRSNLLNKTGSKNAIQLVTFAIKNHLIEISDI